MNSFLLENKDIISVYASLATILIPFVLFFWAQYSERKKEKREQAKIDKDKIEQSIKNEKATIKSFISENIIPLDDKLESICWEFGTQLKALEFDRDYATDTSVKVLAEKNIEITNGNYKKVLATVLQKCERKTLELINIVSYFEHYNYIVKYLDIMVKINYKIRDNLDNISRSDLTSGILVMLSNTKAVSYLIEQFKEVYEDSLFLRFYSFYKHGNYNKEMYLDVLKEYPEYYEQVLKYIREDDCEEPEDG